MLLIQRPCYFLCVAFYYDDFLLSLEWFLFANTLVFMCVCDYKNNTYSLESSQSPCFLMRKGVPTGTRTRLQLRRQARV